MDEDPKLQYNVFSENPSFSNKSRLEVDFQPLTK